MWRVLSSSEVHFHLLELPDFVICFARSREAFSSFSRIEESEVAEFHRDGAWRAINLFSVGDDWRMSAVLLSERGLVVEIECEQKLIPSPACHSEESKGRGERGKVEERRSLTPRGFQPGS